MYVASSKITILSSPSSRRAWIEISPSGSHVPPGTVALLAEGVDRNLLAMMVMVPSLLSPSSRRAWIEMQWLANYLLEPLGRPPRGGRG